VRPFDNALGAVGRAVRGLRINPDPDMLWGVRSRWNQSRHKTSRGRRDSVAVDFVASLAKFSAKFEVTGWQVPMFNI